MDVRRRTQPFKFPLWTVLSKILLVHPAQGRMIVRYGAQSDANTVNGAYFYAFQNAYRTMQSPLIVASEQITLLVPSVGSGTFTKTTPSLGTS